MNISSFKMEGVATPLLISILLSFFPSNIDSIGGQQYFVDMTDEYLPEIIARSFDADFGDVDLDGYLDIYVSNSDAIALPNILLINFQGDSLIDETGDRLPSLIINTAGADFGDVDNDGSIDIIVGNWGNDNQLLINNGLGFFTDGGDILPSDLERDCKDIKFGDVDGDLDLDIIAVNFNQARNLLYINDGTGTYTIVPASRFPSSSDNSNYLDFGDVDGDFDLDVSIANNTGAPNRLMINNGGGYFTDETTFRLPQDLQQSNGIEFGDIDGDGDFDLLVVNGFVPGIDKIWINNGSGVFVDETDLRLEGSTGVGLEGDFGDVDNDSDLDIIIANKSSGGLSTRLYINDGSGIFTDETSTRYPIEDDEAADADFGDIDNDGDLDIIIANVGFFPEGEQNRLLINQSTPDSFPPSIPRTYHHPDTGDTTTPYLITTTVWDNISVVIGELKVSLFYRSMSEINDADFTEIPMLDCGGFLYRENIPAQSSISTVEYYIKAEDRMGNVSYDPPAAPDSVFSFLVDVSVGIGNDPHSLPSLPKAFMLSQNYPNPFNPSTTIDYSIPEGEAVNVTMLIYDLRGRLIRDLINEEKSPGRYSIHWDGRNSEGREVGSGVYLYRIEAGEFASMKKMIIAR